MGHTSLAAAVLQRCLECKARTVNGYRTNIVEKEVQGFRDGGRKKVGSFSARTRERASFIATRFASFIPILTPPPLHALHKTSSLPLNWTPARLFFQRKMDEGIRLRVISLRIVIVCAVSPLFNFPSLAWTLTEVRYIHDHASSYLNGSDGGLSLSLPPSLHEGNWHSNELVASSTNL